MKKLWMLIALLALPLISSADIERSYEYKFVICQVYIDAAASYMEAINDGLSVGDLAESIRESAERNASNEREVQLIKNLEFAALELAAKFNYLNIGDSRVGYDFVRDEGMAMCLDADGDPTQIVL